ncbi:MAG TPA: hypothetical protein PLU30_12065 [Verrucomicrobiae bacterium]|nr:hypothetical protein [Verrucomicrobiae bacterium]
MITDELYLPRAEGGRAPSRVRVGFAEADITPSPGMEIPGGYVKAFADTVHDLCKVRAAVFDGGRNRVAVVGLDTLVAPRPLVDAARAAIQQRCGIEPGAVMIAASHTHSGGPVGMVLPGEFDHATPLVQKLAYEVSSCANAAYLRRVGEQIVDTVTRAMEKRQEAWLSFGKGHEGEVAFNRRFKMKNGLTYTHPGRGHPDIVAPAGPIDPEVGVTGAWDANGKLLGCLVNYACHATTNPEGISANWIYYLERTIQGSLGPEAAVVFLQGASGDITQVNNLSPYVEPSGEESARRVGGCVGAEAVRALLLAEQGGNISVNALSETWEINRRRPSPERVRRCLEMVQKTEREIGHTEWVFAKEIVLLDALLAKGGATTVEAQAIQLGPAVYLTTPAELFVELGLEIKRRSPFSFTWPVELANGCVGYVPTEAAFGPGGGGYETRLTCYSNLEHSAGRQMVDTAVELARRLTPDAPPEPQRAKPAEATWSYGSVPPE